MGLRDCDLSQWLADHCRQIAEHLWAPNLGSGWKAWLYMENGTVKCSYHTASTSPHPDEEDDFFITGVWFDIDDEGSPFDSEYSEVDYIADYIFQGSLDPVEDLPFPLVKSGNPGSLNLTDEQVREMS